MTAPPPPLPHPGEGVITFKNPQAAFICNMGCFFVARWVCSRSATATHLALQGSQRAAPATGTAPGTSSPTGYTAPDDP